MDSVVTVGGVLTVVGIIGGVVLLLGIAFAILAAYAKGFTR